MTLELVGAILGGLATIWGALLGFALGRLQGELHDVERRVRWMETHPRSESTDLR